MQGQSGEHEGTPGAGGRRLPPLNGTGKHRPLPPRPPGLPRVDAPPPTPRVARPQRKTSSPKRIRRNAFILVGVFIVCALLACGIGYAAFNYVTGLTASSGAVTTANDFLTALSTRNYEQAYQDLDPAITLQLSEDEFKQQAQSNDRCFGPVTNYTEVPDSATAQENGNTLSYTYSLTRGKVSKPYQLRLTLQQNPDRPGDWKISSYGDSLGPAQPTCK
jgi:hypothetical protein